MQWEQEREKSNRKQRSNTLQSKVELLKGGRSGTSSQRRAIEIDARDNDPDRSEIVGLDDALVELSLQANFLSTAGADGDGFNFTVPGNSTARKLEEESEMMRTFPQFGIGSIIKN